MAKFGRLINRARPRVLHLRVRPIGIRCATCPGLDVINSSQQNDRCNLSLKHLQYDHRGYLYLYNMENRSYFNYVFTWSSGLALQRSNLGKRDEQKSI